jgi:hypothetical protein
MRSCRFSRYIWAIAAAVIGVGGNTRAAVTIGSFVAYLTNGSLGGLQFPVRYSYDAAGITGGAEDYLQLLSFDFNLLGTQFYRTNIQQGGQVIFHYGTLHSITAEFYPSIDGPAGAPVNQIAFGFGGPGSIGYSDTNAQYGSGFFGITSSNIPVSISLRMEAGYANLTLSGPQGTNCVLRYSTNLATRIAGWTPLATNRMTGTNWIYLDSGSSNSSRRFYAVELVP